MNPNSKRLIISTNSSTLGFGPPEVNVACNGDVNVLITLGEPYMPPYSTLYMCDYLCLNKTKSPLGFLPQGACYVENCNLNSTVYLFSKPFASTSGCFFPFTCPAAPCPSFWTTTIALSLLCLIGFILNITLIVMSCFKRLASSELSKTIIAICVYEALASIILFLDRFLYWLPRGGPDTIVSDYKTYIIAPDFVRAFGSYVLLIVSCFIQAFKSDHKIKSTLWIVFIALALPFSIYIAYFTMSYPLAQYITSKVDVNNAILTAAVPMVMNSGVIGGLIYTISFIVGFIMSVAIRASLSRKLELAYGTSAIEELKDTKSGAVCITMMLLAELLVLLPVFCSMISTVKAMLAPGSSSKFDNVLGALIPLSFLFEAALPILIALIIATIYRPYRRFWLGFIKSETRLIKVK